MALFGAPIFFGRTDMFMLRNKTFLTSVLVYLIFSLASLFSGAVSAQAGLYCRNSNGTNCYPSAEAACMAAYGTNLFNRAVQGGGINVSCRYWVNSSQTAWIHSGYVYNFTPVCTSPDVLFNGECLTPVDSPQDCPIITKPIWSGNGYVCDSNFSDCPDGTIPGDYSAPGFDPRPYCADANPPTSSSSSGNQSSDGQQSSGASSDDNGDGSGSSSGNTGESSASSSSTGSGSGSSGSASSSGQGGNASSAGAGECDPTAKNYLECLNSKQINIPNEKGSFDGTGESAEDRIGELEGELGDLIEQIKGEIQDVTGAHLSGSGTLNDLCYTIFKKQVCFGWSRWSSYLSIIGTAILAAASVASFIIIMRQ